MFAVKVTSTIFSKYTVGDRDSGSIGIIGPTRIDYARLIPSIKYLAGVIGNLLTETLEWGKLWQLTKKF